jgi:hypothetical protein
VVRDNNVILDLGFRYGDTLFVYREFETVNYDSNMIEQKDTVEIARVIINRIIDEGLVCKVISNDTGRIYNITKNDFVKKNKNVEKEKVLNRIKDIETYDEIQPDGSINIKDKYIVVDIWYEEGDLLRLNRMKDYEISNIGMIEVKKFQNGFAECEIIKTFKNKSDSNYQITLNDFVEGKRSNPHYYFTFGLLNGGEFITDKEEKYDPIGSKEPLTFYYPENTILINLGIIKSFGKSEVVKYFLNIGIPTQKIVVTAKSDSKRVTENLGLFNINSDLGILFYPTCMFNKYESFKPYLEASFGLNTYSSKPESFIGLLRFF